MIILVIILIIRTDAYSDEAIVHRAAPSAFERWKRQIACLINKLLANYRLMAAEFRMLATSLVMSLIMLFVVCNADCVTLYWYTRLFVLNERRSPIVTHSLALNLRNCSYLLLPARSKPLRSLSLRISVLELSQRSSLREREVVLCESAIFRGVSDSQVNIRFKRDFLSRSC